MRVIAGEWKGRKLIAPPDGEATVRPTADRVKESLFNILAPRLPDAAVLDLFAGSGALAIESLSRGAAVAVCCDRDTALARRNLRSLGLDGPRVRVLTGDYALCVEKLRRERFDIVFLDPPYAADYAAVLRAVRALDASLYVVEHDARVVLDPVGYVQTDERRYGRTVLTFLVKGDKL
ncbi:MAG: 16S rRNA (guanine(966)-N(2))-methyltransferase RsmD [Eubacteriales bacterium]|nr:16S rRNA (guanine(966)-N(2))-methyltransferase RsmD [Eubacteriales bacterium]